MNSTRSNPIKSSSQHPRGVPRKEFDPKNKVLFLRFLFAPPKAPDVSTRSNKEIAELRALSSIVLLVVFGVFVLLVSLFGGYGLFASLTLNEREQNLRNDLKAMQFQKKVMRQKIEALQNNQDYMEFVARRELGMIRSKETSYALPQEYRLPLQSSHLFPSK